MNASISGNYGKLFFLATWVSLRQTSDPVLLKIVSESPGYIDVMVPGAVINNTYILTPTTTVISLSGFHIRSNTFGKGDKGIMIESTVAVAVFVFEGSTRGGIGDAFALIPVTDNTASYVVQSYEPNQDMTETSQFIIVATEIATNINISLRMKVGRLTYNNKHYSDGDVMNVTLNNLQTFHVYHTHDLSGTIIQSRKPVAVFSGGGCVNIPHINLVAI